MEKEDLVKFHKALLEFPGSIFNEDDPNYEHNMRTLKRLDELAKKGEL